jgi:hypothetical protein
MAEVASKQTLMPPPPTPIILVGYRLRLVPGYEKFAPAYEAPVRTKDPEKRAQYTAERLAEFAEQALTMPHTATFDEVFLSSPRQRKIERWAWSEDRGPGKQRPAICRAAASWILTLFPNAWSNDVIRRGDPQVIFMGFEPRLFLKIMGLECSAPEHKCPLPLGMWYDNADHRDIGKALIPSEAEGHLKLPAVLAARKILPKEGWTGPGKDAMEDVRIATEAAVQLGIATV